MVETVFVLPLLLLVLFAIAQLGLMFNRWRTLSNAVREGARVAVTWDSDCDPDDVLDRVQQTVQSYAQSGNIEDLADGDIVISGAGGACGDPGTDLTVTANYIFAMRIPYASLASVDLTSSSTMRNE